MSRNPFPSIRTLCGAVILRRPYLLLLFLILSLVVPARVAWASVAPGDLETSALRQRMAALEARLAALESAPSSVPESDGVEVPVAARLASVEARLARLEQRLARDPAVRVASLSPPVMEAGGPAAGGSRSSSYRGGWSNGNGTEALSIHGRDLFMPSRGAAGGALHYGAGEDSKLDLHAYFDLEYTDSGVDGERGGISTFDNHHANMFVRARLRDNLLGHMEIEYEHSGSQVEIDQAFVSWTISDAFTLDAGRFYTPFGIERFVQYSPTNALVSRPRALRQIVPGNFYANGLRASGVIATRGSDRFVYEVALSDGLGDDALTDRRGSRQTRDNNASRAISTRIAYAFWPRFEIGTSYHQERYDNEAKRDLSFFGLDVSGRFAGFELRAEYVQANVERPLLATSSVAPPDLEQDGWYAQLGYAFQWDRPLLPELKLVGRYDQTDLDRDVSGSDDLDSFTFGLNALIYEHFRIKTEYQLVNEDGATRENDAFRLQFVVDY